MKNSVLKYLKTAAAADRFFGVLAVLGSVVAAQVLAAPAKAAKLTPVTKVVTNAPVVFVVPKSIFIDDPAKGLDPFFPKSERRLTNNASSDPRRGSNILSGVSVSDPRTFLAMLNLQGISRAARGNRLAVINNHTFTLGEASTIRLGGATNVVTCEDIKDGFVVVSVRGVAEKKTLFLPSK